jgi:hypothetical protein
LIVICHRQVFEEIVQAWTWLHSTPRWAQTDNSSRQKREVPPHSADMGRRMNPIRAGSASQCPSPCVGWIGAQGFSESDRAVLRGGRALGSAVITRGVSRACWASLWKQRYFRSEPSVQHVEGSLKAPGGGSSSVPPSERESQDFAVLPCRDNIPTAFCLTDRSTISDESPIDWTTVEPVTSSCYCTQW